MSPCTTNGDLKVAGVIFFQFFVFDRCPTSGPRERERERESKKQRRKGEGVIIFFNLIDDVSAGFHLLGVFVAATILIVFPNGLLENSWEPVDFLS